MAKREHRLSKAQLKDRAVRFFARYGKDLEQIRALLAIHLTQAAEAYTLQNRLPAEAIRVTTRTKSLASFLKKLERKGWPQYYYASEVAGDLVGARLVCWFLDDCHGVLKLLRSSSQIRIERGVEDFISNPKPSGYRSIHAVAHVAYGSPRKKGSTFVLSDETMPCEVQIRTKLQDSWADVTHEFHYKAKAAGVADENLEALLSDVSDRLLVEDKSLIKFRTAYQSVARKTNSSESRTRRLVLTRKA